LLLQGYEIWFVWNTGDKTKVCFFDDDISEAVTLSFLLRDACSYLHNPQVMQDILYLLDFSLGFFLVIEYL